ncbi:uncharacterized protein LOC112043349 isoform X2 [Bicyclus anynana]|uniref:Uncharacterized protein LOC112043349 isoform X2 n=1 Tax=Bicyclus anynana TaxID=110368 RepID=A0A6J1MJF5_BICAN|nr:uncharacterized protein LOC112043349 isoform X2 [Bicyclus anynana]
MLETEEVDVDYFTPSTSTSLSKIFGSSSKEEDALENSNPLKYNPLLPPQVAKPEESKTTQFLFVDSVYAYEWVNDTYEFRGRVGFAIFNIKNNDRHKMVIYDSNKTRLSCLTIIHKPAIKVNGKINISYYDDQRRFWSVNPSTTKFEEILEILKSLNVNLEFVTSAVEETEKKLIENAEKDLPINKAVEDEKESDTDVSFNKKTKDSILKRMASMGQSVLPPPHVAVAQTSDSSDTIVPQNQRKSRHKPKVINKKSPLEKKILDSDKICELEISKNSVKPETLPETQMDLNIDSNQIGPTIATANTKSVDISTKSNSIELFISEQKFCNSELRIDISRMSDKLEILLDKIKDLEAFNIGSNNSQFQNEITQKLLNEYEKRINKYEEFIKLKGFDCNTFELTPVSKSNTNQISRSTEMETQLQLLCNKKDEEIVQLRNELQLYSNKEKQFHDHEKSLLKEINDLKDIINIKDDCAVNANRKLDDTAKQTDTITDKLKQIMNDTFQAISVNFDDKEMYAGAKIKTVVGLVVKKTTIDSLKEF